jgi:hypothetical protein
MEGDGFEVNVMKYSDFLDTVKVLKMLYGREIAEKFFTKNASMYYNLNSESILNPIK